MDHYDQELVAATDMALAEIDGKIVDAEEELEALHAERQYLTTQRRGEVHAQILALGVEYQLRFTMRNGRVIDRFPWNEGGTCAMFVGFTPGEASERLEYDDIRSVEIAP